MIRRPPRSTLSSSSAASDVYKRQPEWLTASEFTDTKEAGAAKLKQLVTLLQASERTVLYTGAGISASVIGQAARSGSNTVGWESDLTAAKPTPTHIALAALGRAGLIHSWLQQNHDGLPQKAGFPQERINEVHGSWFDPSNPVVKYSGSLHDHAYEWMIEDMKTADLVIVIGTSLGGLTADSIAVEAANRSRSGDSLGTVCINLQQTPLDDLMTLRMFDKSDNVLKQLVAQIGLGKLPTKLPKWSTDAVLVPYDADGQRVPEGAPLMWLDLSDRQRVRITPGHNIQGAQQPAFMHIGATKAKKYKGVVREPCEGVGFVMRREKFHWLLHIEGVQMKLGLWWLDAAQRGAVQALPLVNKTPLYEGDAPRGRR
eukprot:TRINITY_DN4525_c0_g1_i3.p1 TRINITY_DN4525_c0_g1~~TRINITY_DN4525_c0_g1_i3.p1  ORF type:complete len:372 (-),score=75.45 TRINITY_DN4525_c0_g1_i3:93-1208(-)